MARVLVTEEIADSGLQALRDAGHEVDIRTGLSPDQLLEVIPGAHALIIRSATKVTADVIAAGRDLQVVGRAGIGLDNVDVKAATAQGVMVVNAPQSNIVSAAEHAIALLMSQARNVPQASAALKDGRWERSKWEGVELLGKTLGIVGLGRIGALVAQRMAGFGMRLVAFDPYISEDRARQLNCELKSLEDVIAESDFVTIHLPKTPETMGLIGKEMLERAKPGLRIINAARGGIVDETALAEAISSGRVGGAGLDVFSSEPMTESPLFELPSVVVTPHLGASTAEAQDKAGITIAEQVQLALAGDFVPFAVNINAAEASADIKPFLGLAENLGKMFAFLNDGRIPQLRITYQGQISDSDTRILTLAVLKGLFSATTDDPVSYVNAPAKAAERGMEVQETKSSWSHKFVSQIIVEGDDHSVAGTLTGREQEQRLVAVDGYQVEVPPAPSMFVVRNDDSPGMVGHVGMALADANVNIANMTLGRVDGRDGAMMVIATDQPVSVELHNKLLAIPGIQQVCTLSR